MKRRKDRFGHGCGGGHGRGGGGGFGGDDGEEVDLNFEKERLEREDRGVDGTLVVK